MTWLRSVLFNAFFFGFGATYATLSLPLMLPAAALADAGDPLSGPGRWSGACG
jgi:hypothetical protein